MSPCKGGTMRRDDDHRSKKVLHTVVLVFGLSWIYAIACRKYKSHFGPEFLILGSEHWLFANISNYFRICSTQESCKKKRLWKSCSQIWPRKSFTSITFCVFVFLYFHISVKAFWQIWPLLQFHINHSLFSSHQSFAQKWYFQQNNRILQNKIL